MSKCEEYLKQSLTEADILRLEEVIKHNASKVYLLKQKIWIVVCFLGGTVAGAAIAFALIWFSAA